MNSERQKRYRDRQKALRLEGMIKDEQGIPYYPLKAGLTGQRFYPGRLGYHPGGCVCGIVHAQAHTRVYN